MIQRFHCLKVQPISFFGKICVFYFKEPRGLLGMVFEGEEQFTRQLDEKIEPFHPDEAYFQDVLSNLDLDQYDGEDNFFHKE